MNFFCMHALASKRWLHLCTLSFLLLIGSILSGCDGSLVPGGPCEANPGPNPVPDLAVMGDSIYMVSEGTRSLSALRMRDGALEWRTFASYSGILAAEHDIVYVSDYQGNQEGISAVQASNGKRLWSRPTRDQVLVEDGAVYLSHSETVTALDGFTGFLRWTMKQSSVSTLQVFAGVVYILDEQGQLRTFHTNNGTPLWQASLDRTALSFYQSNDFVYLHANTRSIVQDQGVVYVHTDRVYALRASDGHLLWQSSVKRESILSLDVVNGVVSILLDGQAVALRASDGKVLWHSQLRVWYVSLLVTGGILYASESAGTTQGAIIDAFQANDGHLLWHHSKDSRSYLFLLASQGPMLYLLTAPPEDIRQVDANLTVLQGKSGNVLWQEPVRAAAFLLDGAFLYAGLAGNSSSICALKGEDQLTQFRAKNISRVWHVQLQGNPSSS